MGFMVSAVLLLGFLFTFTSPGAELSHLGSSFYIRLLRGAQITLFQE